jgi:hypothetical protein
MEQNGAFQEYAKPLLFTLLVLVAGTAVLYQQGYFSKHDALNPMIFGDMQIKVLFEEDTPELVAYASEQTLSMVPTILGEPSPKSDSMVLGYDEARDMGKENNITVSQAIWGYKVDEAFLGKEVTVTGMLKRTDTLMDMMHILPKDRFDSLPPGEKIHVKYTEDKMPKFFYYIRKDGTNWPRKIRFSMGNSLEFERLRNEKTVANITLGGFDLHLKDGKEYLPLVIGSSEAKMMMQENLFAKPGDKIDGFFGKNVVVAGVLEPTGTALDMFHYMPEA